MESRHRTGMDSLTHSPYLFAHPPPTCFIKKIQTLFLSLKEHTKLYSMIPLFFHIKNQILFFQEAIKNSRFGHFFSLNFTLGIIWFSFLNSTDFELYVKSMEGSFLISAGNIMCVHPHKETKTR